MGMIILLVLYLVARFLQLDATGLLMDNLANSLVLVLVVLFQADIRNALAQFGLITLFRDNRAQQQDVAERVLAACRTMARRKIGALVVFEKEVVAIINNKRNKFYLTKNGEKIKYFNNKKLKNLPNIFGKQKNFLDLYITLNQLNFPNSEIKSFYYFEIGRWDIVLKNNIIIKLPEKNFKSSLKNYLELKEKINFENYSIFDYRIKDQLILN